MTDFNNMEPYVVEKTSFVHCGWYAKGPRSYFKQRQETDPCTFTYDTELECDIVTTLLNVAYSLGCDNARSNINSFLKTGFYDPELYDHSRTFRVEDLNGKYLRVCETAYAAGQSNFKAAYRSLIG